MTVEQLRAAIADPDLAARVAADRQALGLPPKVESDTFYRSLAVLLRAEPEVER